MKHGEMIGTGNTAIVYEWEKGKALKLFHHGYAKENVEKEFVYARSMDGLNFAVPKAYEIIVYEAQWGIVYERIEGESLLDWVMRTGDVQGCAVYMADLHKAISQNSIPNVQSYKTFLKHNILSASSVNIREQEAALKKLSDLGDGDTLCHGDFHPGNILISNNRAMVIDFMNVCHGRFLYDVARTVFLVEYTPIPAEVNNSDRLLNLKKTLADLYLAEMNVTREKIQDYLSVIIAARAGECPGE